MANIEKLKSLNTARWLKAKINSDRGTQFLDVARRLVSAKASYQHVASETGVPWWFIAVVHEREASQNWHSSLAQGDPWNEVSVHVPAGRGPFSSWEEAAVDALVNCAPFAARNKDWSIGGTLTMLEEYNGLGYANRGIASPYVWSGTNQYTSGKYVRDGVFDPDVVDRQLGCAGLLLAMKSLDPSILSNGVKQMGTTGSSSITPAVVSSPAPTKKSSMLSKIISSLSSIFRRT